jgi:hypothetical protein
MSRIINRVRGIRGSFRPNQVITTPTRGTRGPAQLSDINTLASQLGAAGVGSGAAGNGVPSGGSDGQVLAKVASAVAWTFTTAITAVGTIVTGVWHGTKIGLQYGGTNADLSATGGTHSFLKQASSGAAITVAQVDYSDLSGTQPTNAITQLTGDVTAGPGSGSQAATLATVNLNTGTFGDATHVGQFTVNGKGLITAASSVAITGSGGSGTVTSVAMTVPAELSVSGSPVTTSGTLAVTWASEADNTLLSRIAGSSGVPSFNTLTAILDHALGNTNNQFAARISGSWTQAGISSFLTAGSGISLSGTTNVTITNTGASGSPGGSSDYIAPIYGGGPPSIMRAFGEKSVDGGAGTGPAGSGPVGDITIQYNTPKQPGSFIGWDGARFVSTAIISQNTSGPPPTPLAGTVLQLVGKDSVATRLSIAGFATQGNITFQRANGTAASLSALTTADIIGGFGGAGYGATGYSSFQRAQVRFTAAEPWTDSAQGARIAFAVNKLGASSALEQVWIAPDGGLELLLDGVEPTGSTKGGGTINAATYPSYYTNGNWEGGPVNQAPPASSSITIAASHSMIFVRKYTPPNNAKLILGSDAILRGA